VKEIFKIQSISAGYDEKKVLNNISCSINEGDFVAFIGPNGTGKSTLLKVLTGLIEPFSGDVIFKNKSFKEYNQRELSREFSIVHQTSENLLPLNVHDFVRLGRFPFQKVWQLDTEEDEIIIKNAMKTTEIEELAQRPITQLSGGEQQLVFIARALAQSSSIIVLDEPISHLDIKHSIDIMDILYSLNKKGTTIIAVLHDINMASDYCSRIIGLKKGEIFIDGPPKEVIDYKNIEELYDTKCVVIYNPISGKPFVYPVPGYKVEK